MRPHMDIIVIRDLIVNFRVGVTDEERAKPQKLLITIEIGDDFTAAAKTDDLTQTIDYDAVVRRVTGLGEENSWNLIERLAVQIAEMVREEFRVARVSVEVKKFVIPETRYVSVRVSRPF